MEETKKGYALAQYADTPENRVAIIANLEKYPEYKQAPADSYILEISEPSPAWGCA